LLLGDAQERAGDWAGKRQRAGLVGTDEGALARSALLVTPIRLDQWRTITDSAGV
jgi:hypothetical protein